MTIVACLTLTAITTEQHNLFTVLMEILHPPDASLIGVYSISTQTSVFACVMETTKIHVVYLIRALLFIAQNSSHLKDV
jgi:hypothetical protein